MTLAGKLLQLAQQQLQQGKQAAGKQVTTSGQCKTVTNSSSSSASSNGQVQVQQQGQGMVQLQVGLLRSSTSALTRLS
jgi:hypothetical protein